MSVNFSRSLPRPLPRNDALQAAAQDRDQVPDRQRTRSKPRDLLEQGLPQDPVRRHQQVEPVEGPEQPAGTSQDQQAEEALQELLRELKQLLMSVAQPDEEERPETLKEMLQRFQEWLKEMDAIFYQSSPG